MADSFAIARFKARLGPPAKPAPTYTWSAEQRALMLMRAVTMDEIRDVARLLRISFNEAYRERARVYEERWLG